MNDREKKALHAVVEIALAGGRDVRSAELAGALGVSRDSVYQLLLPLVRGGLVVAGRGRTGGYHGAPGLPERRAAEVMAPFTSGAGRSEGQGVPPWVVELESRARAASERVYEAVRVADLVEASRRSRGNPDWQI